MSEFSVFKTREADLIRAAEQRRLLREAREAREARRAARRDRGGPGAQGTEGGSEAGTASPVCSPRTA